MNTNIGTVDRTLRLLISVVLIILFYTGVFSDNTGVIALIVALILTFTSLISYSVLYKLLNIRTIYDKDKKNK